MGDETEALMELEGEWAMVSCVRDGEPVPQTYVLLGKRVAKGNEMTVTIAWKTIMKSRYSLDPSTEPKSIDYLHLHGPSNGQEQYGIYQRAGDSVTFSMSAIGQERPRDFTTKRGDGKTVTVWRFVKK